MGLETFPYHREIKTARPASAIILTAMEMVKNASQVDAAFERFRNHNADREMKTGGRHGIEE